MEEQRTNLFQPRTHYDGRARRPAPKLLTARASARYQRDERIRKTKNETITVLKESLYYICDVFESNICLLLIINRHYVKILVLELLINLTCCLTDHL